MKSLRLLSVAVDSDYQAVGPTFFGAAPGATEKASFLHWAVATERRGRVFWVESFGGTVRKQLEI